MNSDFYYLSIVRVSELYARAGGGGGGGWHRSSHSNSEFDLVLFWIFAPFIVIGVLFFYFYRRNAVRAAKQARIVAASKDSDWNLETLKDEVQKVFFAYQDAWSNKNLDFVRDMLHPSYFYEANELMKEELTGNVNILKDIKLLEMNLMSVEDQDGKNGDSFTMEIIASMIDYTIREDDGAFVRSTFYKSRTHLFESSYQKKAQTTPSTFTEYWVFTRVDGRWKLREVRPHLGIV